MPKRNNPFGDHSSLQLKTYVREKEVNNGVCQQTRMQSVYERTHHLLFTGMRQKQDERSEMLDANDNDMHWSDENTKADGSALKQLHLDSNCQLVCCEENLSSMETDTDNCHNPLPETSMASVFFNSSKTADACSRLSPPSYELSFGRSPNEFSPPSAPSLSSEKPLFEAGSSHHGGENIFLQMMHAQSNKAAASKCLFTSGACHNCRQPVQSKDVMKCQFCENYVCYSCARQCAGCHLHFCQLCSIMNYDQSTERAFCLNCQRR